MDLEKTFKFLESACLDEDKTSQLSQYMGVFNYHMITCSASLLSKLDELPIQKITSFIMECFVKETGLFSAYPGGDGHILHTFNSLQVLLTTNSLKLIDEYKHQIFQSVSKLQSENGFRGDFTSLEEDTRFAFSAIGSAFILHKGLNGEFFDQQQKQAITDKLMKTVNEDGGCGAIPSQESHCANLFTVINALKMLSTLQQVPTDVMNKMKLFLIQRQTVGGGFNGRPEKLQDSCYAHWCGVPLRLLGIPFERALLESFLRSCYQDNGGFADRPEDEADLFHTHFTLCFLAGSLGLKEPDLVLNVDAELVRGWFE